MAFFKCSVGGGKPWPKFIRSIDIGSGVWSVYDCFDVSDLKSVTIKYITTSGTERVAYSITNTYPDRAFLKTAANSKYNAKETAHAYVSMAFDVTDYKYLCIALRDAGNMSYDIVSVT